MNTTDKQHLIEGHFLGCLSEEESAELEALLLNDRTLRDDFRQAAALDAALRDAACPELVEGALNTVPQQEPLPARPRSRFLILLTRAAAVVILILSAVAGWYGIDRFSRPTVARLTNVSGEVFVRGGVSMNRAQHGRRLWSGMDIETAGDRSSAIITWNDGSTMRLDQNTRLNISILEGRKRVALAAGMLGCNIRKQLPGKTMLLFTERSRMEVLGTTFKVTATSAHTTAEVTSGSVKTERLVDGLETMLGVRQKLVVDDTQGLGIEEFFWSDRYRGAITGARRTMSAVLQQTEGFEVEAKKINSRFTGAGATRRGVGEVLGMRPTCDEVQQE